jgi:hypothetical protein
VTASWRSGASAYRMELHQMFPQDYRPSPLIFRILGIRTWKQIRGVCFSVGGLSTAEEDRHRRQKCIPDSTKRLGQGFEPGPSSTKKILKQPPGVPAPSVLRRLRLRTLRLPKKFPRDTFSPLQAPGKGNRCLLRRVVIACSWFMALFRGQP